MLPLHSMPRAQVNDLLQRLELRTKRGQRLTALEQATLEACRKRLSATTAVGQKMPKPYTRRGADRQPVRHRDRRG